MGWQGIFPSIPTPFTADGSVDLTAQRELVRFAIDCEAHGIMCFGLAGEVLRLTPDERKRLCDVILEEANGALPVLIGAGAESERTACELARYAEQAGADGIVLPPPVHARLSKDLLRDFFSRVADDVTIPIMVQDAPQYLGVEVGPELMSELAGSVPQVQYVKLEIGAAALTDWLRVLDGAAAVFGGNGGLYVLDSIRAGAKGIAPGLEVVDLLVTIYERDISGDAAGADDLFRSLLPLLVFEMHDLDHYNLCAKLVLSRRGLHLNTGLRPPATALSPAAIGLLDSYLETLALTSARTA